jgi:hypothetical protein
MRFDGQELVKDDQRIWNPSLARASVTLAIDKGV